MPRGTSRKLVLAFITASVFVAIYLISSFRHVGDISTPLEAHGDGNVPTVLTGSAKLWNGPAIAPPLGNETVKAELGRAAWKLFHTTFARFPDTPTSEESEALNAYIYLFQRLYPCGECAQHFGKILQQYPPQVASRSTAAAWGCHVHNEVNRSLKKPSFDCSKIGDFYDCGCAENEDGDANKKTGLVSELADDGIPADEMNPVELQKEDLQHG